VAVEETKPAVARPTNVAPVVAVEETKPAVARPTNVAPVAAVQPPQAPPPAPAKTAFDGLKLQAIFFSSQHPAALISGQLASVNQEVAGCRVLYISPSSVTLAYQQERKALTLSSAAASFMKQR